ncbi:MAG: hypothetical protein ACR2N4_13450 [Jatrophihabitans sp.]
MADADVGAFVASGAGWAIAVADIVAMAIAVPPMSTESPLIELLT